MPKNIIAGLLLLLMVPLYVMAYLPLVQNVRRNAAIQQLNEIVSRIEWHKGEYHRIPPTLHDAHVPKEDAAPPLAYEVAADGYRLIYPVGSQLLVYDSRTGKWE